MTTVKKQIKDTFIEFSIKRIEETGRFHEVLNLFQLKTDLFSYDEAVVQDFLKAEKEKGYDESDLAVRTTHTAYCFRIENKISGHESVPLKVNFLQASELSKDQLTQEGELKDAYIRAEHAKNRRKYFGNTDAVLAERKSSHYTTSAFFKNYILDSETEDYMREIINAHEIEKAEQKKKEQEAREKQAETHRLEREAWIEKNGSDCLKKMVAGGYEYRKTYENERAAIEFPDFSVDEGGERFDWDKRANPTCEALELAEKVNGRVIWLARDKQDDLYDHDAHEAIKIEPDWCRFALIREM